jgi:unsaturated chondroitin disaccharide hydrolase
MTIRLSRTPRLPSVALLLAAACSPVPLEAPEEVAPDGWIERSLDRAVRQHTALDRSLPDTLFPRTLQADGTLVTNESTWWTSGFFPGSLWYLYEYSGDAELRERALARTRAVEREKLNAGDHDIGFKIFNSFGHAWRLTGDSAMLPVLMTAARTLTTRFDPDVGAIRSWGSRSDTTSPYLVIVDNMMNLELLFWAAEHSGDSTFYDIAVRHADRTLEEHFRPDGSSYHVIEYDPGTGAVLRKRTQQGYADSSTWARGHAWGLYGYTMAYRETGLVRYLEQAKRMARFVLTHPDFPDDGIPYWDFDAPGIPDTYRDASAAAIMASALLELSTLVEDTLRAAYRDQAITTLRTLSRPPYRSEATENAGFLLGHSVGNLPGDSEVDVPLSYADYYYLEGLMRLRALRRASDPSVRLVPPGTGWARSSVNAVIFRRSGLATRPARSGPTAPRRPGSTLHRP